MIRVLTALALGIAAGSFYLLVTSTVFPQLFFGIAGIALAVVLMAIDLAVSFRYSPTRAAIVERAVRSDRIVAGRVERVAASSSSTKPGAFDVDVLVASYPEAPFHARTTAVLPPEVAPLYEVGSVVTVAHPDPGTNRIALAGLPVQTHHRENFTRSRTAMEPRTLPPPKRHTRWIRLAPEERGPSGFRGMVYLVAFLLGAALAQLAPVVGPLFGEPGDSPSATMSAPPPEPSTAPPVVSEPSESPTEPSDPPEEPGAPVGMFDEQQVRDALAGIEEEAGHAEVFRITIHEHHVGADVATAAGADTADSIVYRDGRVDSRRPAPIQPDVFGQVRFSIHDLDVATVFALAEQLPQIAEDHEVPDQEMTHIIIDVDTTDFYDGQLIIRLYTNSDYHSMMVVADADGEIIRVND